MKHTPLFVIILILFCAGSHLVAATPFTDLKVRSAKRGTSVDRDGSYSTAGFRKEVRSTDRIVSIDVEYRTLRDITGLYEIQCFFIGRDPSGEKFVYDAYKFRSKEKDESFAVTAKDLYGGTKTTTVETTTEPITGTSSYGNRVSGTLTTTIFTKSVREGSKCLGWVVRLFYDGKFVRQQASVHDLDQLAKENSEELSAIAEKLQISDIE